jgi:hypothetical protein
MASFREWSKSAQQQMEAALGPKFEFTAVSAEQGDFGDLEGIQFDSDHCGGFLYFWSSGSMQFHLFDYQSDTEVVPNTLESVDTREMVQEFVNFLIQKVKSTEDQ